MGIEPLIAAVASALAGSTIAVSIFSLVQDWVRRLLQMRALSRVRTADVLAASEIDRLGQLLFVDLGATSLADYTKNKGVRDSVQAAFDEVARFLGERSDESVGPVGPPSSESGGGAGPRGDAMPGRDLAWALGDRGDSWEALARARRALEMRLRALLTPEDRDRGARLGAGALLRLLNRRGAIDEGIADQLRYAVSVMNRGIHGDDVSQEETLEALWIVDRFLSTSRAMP
ncbi:hypothetical protein [Actinotalea solisilvae]|uniref:hypothetical protein n=1 Tax=Actinotalea solisilvae TaxID=2072922 RepID=UPI0018F1A01F|nr:hypothetical protein [Actinotalea solisilvae]